MLEVWEFELRGVGRLGRERASAHGAAQLRSGAICPRAPRAVGRSREEIVQVEQDNSASLAQRIKHDAERQLDPTQLFERHLIRRVPHDLSESFDFCSASTVEARNS